MFVRFFDLGAHRGGEIVRMRRILRAEPLVSGWEIYGFEAHPRVARRCRLRFSLDRSVRIVQKALGSDEGTCTLFLNRNLRGSSIYRGKNNVIEGREVEVPLVRFSTWLRTELPPDWDQGFNIIKANIEGAEWDVWHDLLESGLVPRFDLWLGAREGYDGWSEDLPKIEGHQSKADQLTRSIEREGVFIHRFSAYGRGRPNSDVAGAMHRALVARGASDEGSERV